MLTCIPKLRVELVSCPLQKANLSISFPHDDDVFIYASENETSPDDLQELQSLLSREEVERAERFRFERDRDTYIIGRGLLRIFLGKYLNAAPAEVIFQYTSKGKPQLIPDQHCALQFNLTHSGDLILFGFCLGRRIGVDVEKSRTDVEVDQLAERFFSRSERRYLRSLPLRERSHEFFRCWTRKEALLKATGEGITAGLDSFDVMDHPAQSSCSLAASEANWQIYDLEVAPGYSASVAVEQFSSSPDLQVPPTR